VIVMAEGRVLAKGTDRRGAQQRAVIEAYLGTRPEERRTPRKAAQAARMTQPDS
jgi:hypothetical protein